MDCDSMDGESMDDSIPSAIPAGKLVQKRSGSEKFRETHRELQSRCSS